MIGKKLEQCNSTNRHLVALRTACLFLVAALAAGLAGSLCVPALAAATLEVAPAAPVPMINVTTLADTNDGACDADCSLREALAVAPPNHIVAFASSLTGTITLRSTLTIIKNVTITGPSTKAITISGNNAARVFYVDSGVNFTIRNLTVAKGRIKGTDGSIGVYCRPGQAGGIAQGGGLYNDRGIVTIIDSTFSGNRAVGGKGGARGECMSGGAGGPGGDGMGGALFTSGIVFLVNSTFSGNTAKGGGGGNGGGDTLSLPLPPNNNGPGGNGYGGAILSSNDMWASNCTFAGNSASGAMGGFGSVAVNGVPGVGSGGAIYRPGAFPIKNTLAINRSGVITIKNTLIVNTSSGGNCDASINSEGYNIDSDGTCGLTATGDLSKADPKMGPLKNNGGATPTHALLPSSPAIDGGNPAGCADHEDTVILTDQRGRSRLWGGRCDIGAFEVSR